MNVKTEDEGMTQPNVKLVSQWDTERGLLVYVIYVDNRRMGRLERLPGRQWRATTRDREWMERSRYAAAAALVKAEMGLDIPQPVERPLCVRCGSAVSKKKGGVLRDGSPYHLKCIPLRDATEDDRVKGADQRRAVREAVLRGDRLG